MRGLAPARGPLPCPQPVGASAESPSSVCERGMRLPRPGRTEASWVGVGGSGARWGGPAGLPMALLFRRKTPWASPPSSSAR